MRFLHSWVQSNAMNCILTNPEAQSCAFDWGGAHLRYRGKHVGTPAFVTGGFSLRLRIGIAHLRFAPEEDDEITIYDPPRCFRGVRI